MDKNCIEGRHGAMSWHNTTKTSGMPVEVNAAAVQQSNVSLPGEISPAQASEKSAEIIVRTTFFFSVERKDRILKPRRFFLQTYKS